MSALAHKTLIDGTAYDIVGGSTLINGTGYSIASGKTKIDGTGYNINFTRYEWPGWSSATWKDINDLCVAKQQGLINEWPSDVVVGARKFNYFLTGYQSNTWNSNPTDSGFYATIACRNTDTIDFVASHRFVSYPEWWENDDWIMMLNAASNSIQTAKTQVSDYVLELNRNWFVLAEGHAWNLNLNG